ncbi:RING finger domain-containing protein [Zalerion maritima]|uniref:RING-type E3 ubiquitin transferase n=1 Tax=Zalerion maritima TaxID=339359 RepID=A0AAD5S0I9_9PEZI|nr:RING finger domain-containing protein [Zalerion maritima]
MHRNNPGLIAFSARSKHRLQFHTHTLATKLTRQGSHLHQPLALATVYPYLARSTATLADLIARKLQWQDRDTSTHLPRPQFRLAFRLLRTTGLLVGLGLATLAALQHGEDEDTMDPPRRNHLDATAGREVVYCHSCRNEWFRDEGGLRCPNCEGEIIEIVSPGEDDPRSELDNDPLADVRRFDRTPHPYHRHQQHEDGDSDPEEGYVDDDGHPRTPGSFLHSTLFEAGARQRNRPGDSPGGIPPPSQNPSPGPGGPNAAEGHDPDRTFVLRRFQEMLLNDFRMGSTGRSGRDTLFPEPPTGVGGPQVFHRHMSYNSGRGGLSMSFTVGGGSGGGGGGGGGGFPPNPFDQYGDSPLYSSPSSPFSPNPSRSTPLPAITFVAIESTNSNNRPRMFSNIMGFAPQPAGPGIPSPIAAAGTANQRVGQDLATILASLLGSIGTNGGVHGDAVYTQEAMDRILSQLMEQNQGSNAPPPASDEAMRNLPRRPLDNEMLPEGTGECTICIQDVELGEEMVVLPCTHWFHEDCIMHWLREHGTCPICRQPIDASGGQTRGSSQPPPSGSGASSGNGPDPGSEAGAGGSQQQSQGGSIPFSFFTTSSSAGDGGASGSTSRVRLSQMTNQERQERLNAIGSTAGFPPGFISANQSSPSSFFSNRGHRSRSRSPPRFGSSERRQRSPSSQSRRSSMFSYGNSDRASNRRDRERRTSQFAASGPGRGTAAASSGNNNDSGSGSGRNNVSGPFMGWFRNPFQGRRS